MDATRTLREVTSLPIKSLPIPNKGQESRESGLSCAVILLRHMIGRCSRGNVNATVTEDALEINHLLAAALISDREETMQKAKEALAASQSTPESIPWAFETLISSDAVEKTVWQKKIARLWLPRWSIDAETKKPVLEPDCWKNAAELSIISWNGLNAGSLSEVCQDHVDRNRVVVPGGETRAACWPSVIRVHYTSENPEVRFRRDLWQLEISMQQLDLGKGKLQQFTDAETVSYRCIAAVRLRDQPEGTDSLRIYNSLGMEILPESRADRTLWGPKWNIQKEGKYQLFYVAVSDERFHVDRPKAEIAAKVWRTWETRKADAMSDSQSFSLWQTEATDEVPGATPPGPQTGVPGTLPSETQPAPLRESSPKAMTPQQHDEAAGGPPDKQVQPAVQREGTPKEDAAPRPGEMQPAIPRGDAPGAKTPAKNDRADGPFNRVMQLTLPVEAIQDR
ncbi:hypothetical protein B0T14DRAFT_570863 [Immersiella caudata]|uniref:Uncharacterized protein n=1 Tax=Immersiella caudata TaxID=314043 RepID=A0AA39WA04_9PEZI|nr:hypothetical protein B0T14DRAFT_570863 [Immersiella caudata]